MEIEYDTRTYFDKAGTERWADDDTAIDQKNVFRQAYDGQRIDTAKMAQAARNSAGSSRAVSRDAANGKPRGTLRGISQKADANLKLGVPDVYAGKSPIPSNWASVKRERA
jgi:hypothetical protein